MLATARFVAAREDVLFLGPPGTGKSHLAQAIGRAAIQQGYRVVYREARPCKELLQLAARAGPSALERVRDHLWPSEPAGSPSGKKAR